MLFLCNKRLSATYKKKLNNSSNMIERIKEIIAGTGLNDSAFAKKIGVQQMTLWRQLNGTRKMGLETIMAIANEFPDINCNWLLRGEGNMFLGADKKDRRLDNLIDVITMQQETIRNLQEKIKQLQKNQ